MFEKEAKEYVNEEYDFCYYPDGNLDTRINAERDWKNGAEFGYNKGKEELTERLDNALEIIELMKDLFFDCWQEKGLKAIKFEQRVNNFLRGE